ncbi:hypothetical protein FB451DRAFT_1415351 [Mycena latifolia]|nr:hypothetical protein FB451DRAFT_1415351 [Mycena latifolia]
MSEQDIPATLGALLIGGLFASLFVSSLPLWTDYLDRRNTFRLGGMVNLQTTLYYGSYKSDPLRIKFLVLSVWLLDNLHTGLIWGGLWFGLVQNYGEYGRIDTIPWCIALTVILTALITFLVHCFFAHRIFLLSKKNWLMTSPVLFLALVRLAAASASTWQMLRYHSFNLFRTHAPSRWVFSLGLIVSSAVDILIAGFLVHLFRSNRTEAGRFNDIIDKLIQYGLETGSLTCFGTIVTMLCWVIAPKKLIFFGLHVVIGKLYANSLLVTLNARKKMRLVGTTCLCEQRTPVVFLESRTPKSAGPSAKSPTFKDLQINVHTQTNVQYDRDAASIASAKCN